MAHPRVLLARVQAERNGGSEGERRILAEIIIIRGVSALHGAVLHGIEDLQAADDLAGREQLDVELAAGGLRYALGEEFHSAVKRVQALRPAQGHAPGDGGRLRADDAGRCARSTGRQRKTSIFQKGTTFHADLLKRKAPQQRGFIRP